MSLGEFVNITWRIESTRTPMAIASFGASVMTNAISVSIIVPRASNTCGAISAIALAMPTNPLTKLMTMVGTATTNAVIAPIRTATAFGPVSPIMDIAFANRYAAPAKRTNPAARGSKAMPSAVRGPDATDPATANTAMAPATATSPLRIVLQEKLPNSPNAGARIAIAAAATSNAAQPGKVPAIA